LSKKPVFGAKSKIDCFEAKSSEIGHIETALAAQAAKFFEMVFILFDRTAN
jgi:hypothetical protein